MNKIANGDKRDSHSHYEETTYDVSMISLGEDRIKGIEDILDFLDVAGLVTTGEVADAPVHGPGPGHPLVRLHLLHPLVGGARQVLDEEELDSPSLLLLICG